MKIGSNAYDYRNMSLIKRYFIIIILGVIFSNPCLTPPSAVSNYGIVNNKAKYFDYGIMEEILFYAQHQSDSSRMIPRMGFLLTRPHALGTVLICHGFMCDKYDTAFIRTMFPHYNVMTFDFRAHGEKIDNYQCCTFGRDEAYDVIAAVNYLKSRPDLQGLPRIVYGFSMGAVAAIQAQSSDATLFDLMVLDCPYDCSDNIIKKGLENFKINIFGYSFSLPGQSFLENYAYNPYVQSVLKVVLKTIAHMDATETNTYIYPIRPVESIKKITIPCFFIHCRNDEKVSVQAAKDIFENAAASYKKLWITDGRRHFDSFFYNPEKYMYRVNRFIQKGLAANQHLLYQKMTDDAVQKHEKIVVTDIKSIALKNSF